MDYEDERVDILFQILVLNKFHTKPLRIIGLLFQFVVLNKQITYQTVSDALA